MDKNRVVMMSACIPWTIGRNSTVGNSVTSNRET